MASWSTSCINTSERLQVSLSSSTCCFNRLLSACEPRIRGYEMMKLAMTFVALIPTLAWAQCIAGISPHGPSVDSSGWTPRSRFVLSELSRCFPGKFTCGGQTRASTDDHSRGNALDCFPGPAGVQAFGVDKAEGDELAAWLVANARKLRIYYVIWYRHIWTFTRSAERWRDCKFSSSCIGEGGATITHLDHIHISVYGSNIANPDFSAGSEPGAGLGPPPVLRCQTAGVFGTCISTSACAAQGKRSTPQLCPGPTEIQCCT